MFRHRLTERIVLYLTIVLFIAAGSVRAQSISISVTNIPVSATRVIALADTGGAPVYGVLSISPGTAAATVAMTVPASDGYRIRVLADNSTGLLRSGKTSGVSAPVGSSVSISIPLADVTVALDPSTPAAAPRGSAIQILFNIVDPGDVIENQKATLFTSSAAFSIPSGRAFTQTVPPKSSSSYPVAFQIATPVLGATLYYSCRLTITAGDQSSILDLSAGGSNRTIVLSGSNLSLTVGNIPAAAITIGVMIDGGGLATAMSGAQTAPQNSGAVTLSAGAIAGGPYRIRVFATDGTRTLRSGKATGVYAPASGSTTVPISLADIAVTTDASTPARAMPGAVVQIRFNITDPGDIAENGTSWLFGATVPVASFAAGTAIAFTTVVKIASGIYTMTFNAPILVAMPAYYYAARIYTGGGDATTNIDSSASTAPTQVIFLTGAPLTITIMNIPSTAIRLTALLDSGPWTAVLEADQDIAAGTASASIAIVAPASGTYRVRVLAFDSGGLLRSGKAPALNAPSNTPSIIALDEVGVVADAAMPLTASAGALVQLRFNIADPGDIIEGRPAALYYSAGPFASPAGTYGGTAYPIKNPDGTYSLTFSATMPAAGTSFYYAFHIPTIGAALDFPRTGAAAWQIALGSSCSYNVQPASISASATGASDVISVTASSPECPWNAHSSATWITLSAGPAAGSGTLSYTIAAGAVSPRSAVVRIGTKTINVTQSPAAQCNYAISSPGAGLIPAQGGAYIAQITATAGCAWTVSTPVAWISITAGAGIGSGNFAYTVASNPAAARTSIIALNSQKLIVNQFAASSKIFWQNDSDRSALLWNVSLQGMYQSTAVLASAMAGWRLIGAADFNGDGIADLVWQNDSDSTVIAWYMGGNGAQYLSSAWLASSPVPGWRVVALADLNQDGYIDLVWQNNTTREVVVWYMQGAQYTASKSIAGAQPGWRLAAVADLNGDGSPDLIWQNDTTREVVAWYMQGSQYSSSAWVSSSLPGWRAVAFADLNQDGKPDLVWQNDATRGVVVWYLTGPLGNQLQSSVSIASSAAGWSVVSAR